jgi:hypothetical protein
MGAFFSWTINSKHEKELFKNHMYKELWGKWLNTIPEEDEGDFRANL